jgi:hypothetical protein
VFLGVRSWSASHMATAAEQLAEKDAAFRKALDVLLPEIS